MRLTEDEIREIVNQLGQALLRTKEALRIAKKAHGSGLEVVAQLKYAYPHVQEALKILEMRSEGA